MTKTVSDEKIVISTETMPANEEIVKRKTIVYETLIDPTVMKVTAEKLKGHLFTRFGFFSLNQKRFNSFLSTSTMNLIW